jgi:hypothetical protein
MSNPEFTAPDFTSQTAAAYKANIDASIAANGADSVNLAFSYASGTGTFTVHDAQGGALSASNPGFIKFQDPDNPGYYKYISVEANQDFIDDAGSSEIINNLFGFPSGTAVGDDVTFTLYAVSNDDMDAVAFMISRDPTAYNSPAAANIGAPDDAVADQYGDFFALDSLDETLYDSNPCTAIGTFRMQMSASDDWTVQTIDARDGIGKLQPYSEGGWVKMATYTESASNNNLDFLLDANVFDDYRVELINCIGSTDAAEIYYRTSTDGGATFDSGASDYNWQTLNTDRTNASPQGSLTDSKVIAMYNISNVAAESASGHFTIFNPSDATYYTKVGHYMNHTASSGSMATNSGAGTRLSAADVDAFRLYLSAGNWTGKFILYGRKH